MIKERIKKALITAFTFGAGNAVGGCSLPRCVLPGSSSETKAHIWRDAAIYFSVAFLLFFAVSLLIPTDRKQAK